MWLVDFKGAGYPDKYWGQNGVLFSDLKDALNWVTEMWGGRQGFKIIRHFDNDNFYCHGFAGDYESYTLVNFRIISYRVVQKKETALSIQAYKICNFEREDFS